MSETSNLSRRAALALTAAAAMAVATPAAAVGAIKHYIIIELMPDMDQLVLERWYITYHSREVRRAFKAWQRNYVSYRSYLPSPEALKAYPTLQYGRMTEIQFDSIEDFQESRPNNIYGKLDSMTPPPGGWRAQALSKTNTVTVPINPQDLFVSLDTPPKEIPYVRWLVFYSWPKGVDEKTAEAWYRDVHVKEMSKLPGLMRFARYRTIRKDADFTYAVEYWFNDMPSWKKAFLPVPKLTPPPWGGTFPFVDTVSMFIGENPDIDFINDKRAIP